MREDFMTIINEVLNQAHREQHEKNICLIKKEIEIISRGFFGDCMDFVRNIIITDNLCYTMRIHRFSDLNENANAIAHKFGEGYDIIVNYNNVIFESERGYFLRAEIGNYLFHEFQHVRDNKKHNEHIEQYVQSNNIQENNAIIGEMIFKEFNASYKAQMYNQIIWIFNKYDLDSCIEKHSNLLKKIKEKINNFYLEETEECKQNYLDIATDVLEYTRSIMYSISLACGTNAADNQITYGRKYIDIIIEGIDIQVDCILNDFINGLNAVISDEERIWRYTLNSGMCVFECINKIFKRRLQELL